MSHPRTMLGSAAFALLFVPVAAAQTLELRAGVTAAGAGVETAFATSYTPTLNFSTDTTGHAGQQVRLTSGRPWGVEGGLGVFFSQHAGLELSASWMRTGLEGTLGDYSVVLNYTSRQPPDNTPRPYTLSYVVPGGQPATGHLSQLTLGASLVGRWALSPVLTTHLAAGVSYARAAGDAEPLDYTVFQMGGHSVLMSDSYSLAYDLEATHTMGVTLGVGLDVRLMTHLALTLDASYRAASDIEMPIRITAVRNSSDIYLSPQDVGTIQQTLKPGSVTVPASRARLFLGCKLRR